MISRKQAKKLVQEKYGPTASVVNVSSKDRNQRFGVMFVEVAGLDQQKLACFGYGDSYEAAMKMADENPIAQKYAEEWNKMKTVDWEKFRLDPHGYLAQKKAEIEKAMEVEAKSDVGIHEV